MSDHESYRDRYMPLVRKVLARLDNPQVLKTDAFNESLDLHPITESVPAENVTIVEIDPSTAATARANHPDLNIVEGDIRRLDFDSATFDVVLDLSTIDHIEHPHLALREYARVLKPYAHLLIVSWVYLGRGTQKRPSAYGGWQYFFDLRAFRKFLRQSRIHISDGWILTPNLVGRTGGHDLLGVDLHAYLGRVHK